MRLLVTEPNSFHPEMIKLLKNKFQTYLLSNENFIDNLDLNLFEVFFIKLKYKIDAKILSKSTNLKYILSPTTGLNHIDIDLCKEKNITIVNLNSSSNEIKNIPSTAEHTMALILNAFKKINSFSGSVMNNTWDRYEFNVSQLCKKSIGIVGFGRIGKLVAKYCRTFGMEVYVYDIEKKNYPKWIHSTSLKYIFSNMDVISIHINYKKYDSFFNSELFNLSKNKPILINTSRGELINENDLIASLKNNRISFCSTRCH